MKFVFCSLQKRLHFGIVKKGGVRNAEKQFHPFPERRLNAFDTGVG